MPDKLRNTANMIFDIYEENFHESEVIKKIYSELARNATSKMPRVNSRDRKALIFIALMYDKNSPLQRETIDRRRMIAVEQADFDSQQKAEDVVFLRDSRVLMLIHYYLKYQNDFAWSSYILNSEVFWQNQQTVLKGASDPKEQETIMKLMEGNEKLRARLKGYEDEILGDNKDKMLEILNYSLEDYVAELEAANPGRL